MKLTRRVIEKSSEPGDTIYCLTSDDRTNALEAIGQGDTMALAAFHSRSAAGLHLWQYPIPRLAALTEDERIDLSEFCELEKSYCSLLEDHYALSDAEQAENPLGTR